MIDTAATLPAFALAISLGLRHGLDPDHLSIIDGMTLRTFEQDPRLAPWTGTLFALGHGGIVTAIAVGVSLLSRGISLPDPIVGVLEWLPIFLLFMIGSLNLRALLRAGDFQIIGWKARFLPRRLRESTHPLAIIGVGGLFGLVFDTATQATAWGLAATTQGGVLAALGIGAAFTLGMAATDSIDSRLMCRLMKRIGGRDDAKRYRRGVGWVVVALSFGAALYSSLCRLNPAAALGESAYTLMGLLMFLLLVAAYLSLTMRAFAFKKSSLTPLQ